MAPPGSVAATTLASAPNAPAGLTAVAGSPAYGVVGLSWTASVVDSTHDAAATYTPQYRIGAGAWTTFGSPVAGTSVNVTGLAHGTAYSFQVIAANTGGTATAGPVSATTATAVPNAATGLSASAGSPAYSAVNLSWAAPAVDGSHDAASSYAVSFGTDGTTWTLAAGAWTSGTTATVSGLAASTAYYFQVVASNAGGAGGTVATGSTIATGVAAPNVPSALTVAPVKDGTTSTLAVSWTAPATDSTHGAATGYTLNYRVTGAGSWTAGPSGSATSATLTGLTTGTSYDVQVQATNASSGSPSAWSGTTAATTYAIALAWTSYAPPAIWTHSVTNIVQTADTPNPAGTVGMTYYFSASATVNTNIASWSALGSGGWPIAGNVWGAYMTAPAATGTYYVWAVVNNGTGVLVSYPIAVT